MYEDGVVVKKLGDICEFKNGQNITKSKLIDGIYPVVGGGRSPLGYHNSYNVDENTLLISKDGSAGFVSRYNTKVFVSNHGIFVSKYNECVNKDFVYYYLKIVLQDRIYKLQTGVAQPGINKEDVANLTIPVPPLKRQEEIVARMTDIYAKNVKLQEEIELNKQKANNIILEVVKKV